jgi:hypothetical protein
MKEIGISFTILRTITVSDDFQEEDIENKIDEKLSELFLDRDDVNDIDWEVLE